MLNLPRRGAQRIFASFGRAVVPKATLPMNARNMRHFALLIDLFGRLPAEPGTIVECGVGKGRSFLQFTYLIHQEGKGRELWGFDSFEGFPTPALQDKSIRDPKKGEWSGISSQDILNVLLTAGFKNDFVKRSIHLVPGFFEQTLTSYSGEPIALLHIDADLYSSYKEVLETLVPYVIEGGIILLDEYDHPKWPGATLAVNEFLAGTPWKLEYHSAGDRWFFVKTK